MKLSIMMNIPRNASTKPFHIRRNTLIKLAVPTAETLSTITVDMMDSDILRAT